MGNLPKLTQFVAGSMTKSINIHAPDLNTDLQYSPDTINVSQGIYEGTGPRHGMAPIPGQADTEAPTSLRYPNLRRTEANWGVYGRVKVYGIFPFVLGGSNSAQNLATKNTYYAVLISYTDSTSPTPTAQLIDLIFLSTKVNTIALQSPNIYEGLAPNSSDLASLNAGAFPDKGIFFEGLGPNYQLTNLEILRQAQLLIDSNYVCSTSFSVNNSDIACEWLVGSPAVQFGFPISATIAPGLDLGTYISISGSGYADSVLLGITSDIIYGKFKKSQRNAIVYGLKSTGGQSIDWRVAFSASDSQFKPSYNQGQTNANIDLSQIAAVKIAGGTNYFDTAIVVYNDSDMVTNPSYQGVLVAGSKAYCFLVQDWIRSYNGTIPQYVDLVNLPYQPISVASNYQENGALQSGPFGYFPNFVTGTAMAATGSVALLGAGSGILRANTIYELGYSVFNKRWNYESNVSKSVKFQTGSNDFVALQLWDSAVIGGAETQAQYNSQGAANYLIPMPGNRVAKAQCINYLEYRIYYRQLGAQEWLPALFIDAVNWWFNPHHTKLAACTGGIGGLPGGRPGGFVDYSPLTDDQYTCVVMYKNRAFWFSDKAISYSLQNNIFAYPASNTAACPVGSFKGALVQAYYGQAQQDARLVIFTTSGTYVGKFTGSPQQVPVQVSTTTVANFDLEGTDFEVNAWTSISAFSYRSAVVAEGILYMWGPSGVFRDDGVTFITRISMPIEPDIFNYSDPSKTDEICTLYNDTSKEIYWFYRPKVADGYATHALVYNTVRESWLFAKFSGSIDYAQQIIVKSNIATAGTRGVVYSRKNAAATVQRAAYFDQNNRACDIFPAGELMVKSISTPATGQRAFTLAAGYDATNFATIAVGDLIAVSQAAAYASTLVTPTDFIGTVAAAAAGVITVNLPTGVAFDASATFASNALYMPIWHFKPAANGINGFPYVLDSFHWLPGGFSYWAYWLHVHMMFKLTQILPAATPLTFNFAYRTPVSDLGEIGDDIAFANNSDGNFQVLHPLRVGNQNLEGQGLKFTISGIQGAGGWMIQYLEAYTQFIDGMQLKLFEG